MARGKRAPRVVAELGRPETPEETAARLAENSRQYRARKTVNNLIYSLIAVLGTVAVIYFVVPRSDVAPDWQIDYRQVAEAAASAAPGPLMTPELPATWRANRAELTRVDGRTAWVINFITPEDEYVTYTQIFGEDERALDRLYGTLRTETQQLDIGGLTWSEFDNTQSIDPGQPDTYVLGVAAGGDLFLLDGRASSSECAELARALTAQITGNLP